jgi:hypothetical protein
VDGSQDRSAVVSYYPTRAMVVWDSTVSGPAIMNRHVQSQDNIAITPLGSGGDGVVNDAPCNQYWPDITAFPEAAVAPNPSNLGIVVVWGSGDSQNANCAVKNSYYDIYLQLYNYRNGGYYQLGTAIRANQVTAGLQTLPRVVQMGRPYFVVTWVESSTGARDTSGDIYARIFSLGETTPNAVTTEFLVNSYTNGVQSYHAVESLGFDGRYHHFVVAWQSYGQDGNGVYSRVFRVDPSNYRVQATNEFMVNVGDTIGNQYKPTVVALTTSRFVVAFHNPDGLILAQAYDFNAASFTVTPFGVLSSTDLTGTASYSDESLLSGSAVDSRRFLLVCTTSSGIQTQLLQIDSPPVIVGSVPSQRVALGSTISVGMNTVFADPEGDSTTFDVKVDGNTVDWATVTGQNILFHPISIAAVVGLHTVHVIARDGLSAESATYEFHVVVYYPITVLNNPPARLVTVLYSTAFPVNYFSSQASLGYSATYTSASAFVALPRWIQLNVDSQNSPSVSVQPTTNSVVGVYLIRICAANGLETQCVDVSLNVAADRAPLASRELASRTVVLGRSAVTMLLSDYFTDPDGNSLTYAISATALTTAASNTEIWSLTKSNAAWWLTLSPKSRADTGDFNIQITVSDGLLSLTCGFVVHSLVNQSPVITYSLLVATRYNSRLPISSATLTATP